MKSRTYLPFKELNLVFSTTCGPEADENGVAFKDDLGRTVDISESELREMIRVFEDGSEEPFVVRD